MPVEGPKPVEALTLFDLKSYPVWRFVDDDSLPETSVQPVQAFPVADLRGCVVAVELRLASGSSAWGILGNLDLASAERTAHFLALSVLHREHWFHLARYHDPWSAERGPNELASFLGMAVHEVFPLTYDITSWCLGLANVVRGTLPAEPRVRLSRAELIALAIP
jgi:hypothetical protein